MAKAKKYYVKKVGDSNFERYLGTSSSAYCFEEETFEDTGILRLTITRPANDSEKAKDACAHEFTDWLALRKTISEKASAANPGTSNDMYTIDVPLEDSISDDCFDAIVKQFNDWIDAKAGKKDESKDKKDGDKPAPAKSDDKPADKSDDKKDDKKDDKSDESKDKKDESKDKPMKDLADWTDDDLDKYFDEDIIPV